MATQGTTQKSGRAKAHVDLAVQNMAVQDYVIVVFLGYEVLRAFTAPENEHIAVARPFALLLFSVAAATILSVRGEILPAGKFRGILYRVLLLPCVVISYFLGSFLLPGLEPILLDAKLHAIDLALFTETPSVWLAQFNTLPVVEWFSFFYYSYFYIMAVMLVPALFFDKGRRLAELTMGATLVASLGHTGYTLVPGVGPYAVLDFAPLNGGFWWSMVESTVANGGAQLDIFPSLHTAYPTFYALHAFGNRHTKAFKYTWPILAFFSLNIIVATMFLRWHWGIDVVFGIGLALFARAMGVLVGKRVAMRKEAGVQPVWEPLFSYQTKGS